MPTTASRMPEEVPIPRNRRSSRRLTIRTTISGATDPVEPVAVVVVATTTANGAAMAITIKVQAYIQLTHPCSSKTPQLV